VKQSRVLQTDILGLSETVKSAAVNAGDVDRNALFRSEAIVALKAAILMSCWLSCDLGGRVPPILALTLIARAIGSPFSSAGMVFAMRHSQELTAARSGEPGEIGELTASATMGSVTGSDPRSSSCAMTFERTDVLLETHARVFSSPGSADRVWLTSHRVPHSAWGALTTRPVASFVPPIGHTAIVATGMTGMLLAALRAWAAVWLGLADAARPPESHAPQLTVRHDRILSSGAQLVRARRGHGIEAQ
jgi:hypothetical protein